MSDNRLRGFEVVSTYKPEKVKLPVRATTNSAGYDFFALDDLVIEPSFRIDMHAIVPVARLVRPVIILTGVKAFMQSNEVLHLYIRSSLGIKLGLMMANSVGVIDMDYYNNSKNEGEILFAYYNLTHDIVRIPKGEGIGQGVFTNYFTDGTEVATQRVGGVGSTSIPVSA